MVLARNTSVAFVGIDAVPVTVEVDVSDGEKFSAVVVGLPDAAVRESKDRVIAAIRNSDHPLGTVRCTINLAPGDLKKEGPLYDLPIAIGMLIAKQVIPAAEAENFLMAGELALSGELQPIRGALALALLAKAQGKQGVIVPLCNAKEAALVPGVSVIGVRTLKEAIELLKNPQSMKPYPQSYSKELNKPENLAVDFADIKGQFQAKRALEIAAAGGHNVLLCGPPGSGKTMMAKALCGIMPDLGVEEALETTKIHSIAGLLKEGHTLITARPFRSPHHTVSYAGLIGGGATPRPGEVSLAHNGVLFLDEFPEFSRQTLEVLRQPLEDLQVTISRAQGNLTFPANFVCIAAMNPCPCGYRGHPTKTCKDSPIQIERYQNKISGPLLDRIDMHLSVPCVKIEEFDSLESQENSQTVKERVMQARQKQVERYQSSKTNSQMLPRDLQQHCRIDPVSKQKLREAIHMGLSARAHGRVLKVARTIADLEGSETVQKDHIMESLCYR